jgi:hypothetical protein
VKMHRQVSPGKDGVKIIKMRFHTSMISQTSLFLNINELQHNRILYENT